MRPQEILGMVEEAAGTRMFEERKDKAKKTMGKKDKRVQEITVLLAEEITPKLDTLRAEKRAFLQWQKACSELERIGRVLRAWEWTDGHGRVERKQVEIGKKEKEIGKTNKERERTVREGEAAERDLEEVVAKREQEMKKGGKFKKREEEVTELEKVLVKLRTQVEIKDTVITDEESKMKASERELEDVSLLTIVLTSHAHFLQLNKSLTQNRAQVEVLTGSYASVKEKHTSTQAALSKAEELLQTLLTGLSSSRTGNATGGGYMGQLADAKAQLAHASAEEEQIRVRLGMSERELKTLASRWKEVEREANDGKKNLAALKSDVERFRKKVSESGWSAEQEREGEIALSRAKGELRQFTEVSYRLPLVLRNMTH